MTTVTCRLPAIAAVDSIVPANLLPLIELADSLKIEWDDFDYVIRQFEHGPCDMIEPDDLLLQIPNPDLLDKDNVEKVFVAASEDSHALLTCANKNAESLAILIFRRKDGNYVYFNTWCDNTGYGCQGATRLGYSTEVETFWNRCLDHTGRLLLYKRLIG